MFLLYQLYCCRYRRYRFDIDTISFPDCRISCNAVDIVDIDTISFHDCWISCITVNIVDIDSISSISIRYRRYRYDIVDIDTISSISIRYRRYRYDIVKKRSFLFCHLWETTLTRNLNWHVILKKVVLKTYSILSFVYKESTHQMIGNTTLENTIS